MSAPFTTSCALEDSLLSYAETVECLDGGSCFIEDLFHSLLRILSECLFNQANFFYEASDTTLNDF
jgi:hypothetical protein